MFLFRFAKNLLRAHELLSAGPVSALDWPGTVLSPHRHQAKFPSRTPHTPARPILNPMLSIVVVGSLTGHKEPLHFRHHGEVGACTRNRCWPVEETRENGRCGVNMPVRYRILRGHEFLASLCRVYKQIGTHVKRLCSPGIFALRRLRSGVRGGPSEGCSKPVIPLQKDDNPTY